MQKKITINNSNQTWNPKKRYKINEVVSHNGIEYQNSTGINTEPGIGSDWLSLDVTPKASVETSGTVKLTSFDENPKVYPKGEMDDLLDEKLNIADIPSNLSLYPTNVASDISGYSKMVVSLDDVDYNDTAVDISTDAISTTDQLVASLASAAGILIGNPGIINVVTIGNVKRLSGTGTAEFYFKIFKRTSAGVESLIATSNATMPISNSVYGEFQATAILNNGSFIETDRIVIKYFANRIAGNSNPVYQFQFGGVTPVRTVLPVPFSVIPVSFNTEPLQFNTTDRTVWNRGKGNIVSNTSFGEGAFKNNISGGSNSAYALGALQFNESGNNNSAFGEFAMEGNVSGSFSSAFGKNALGSSNGSYNTAIGYRAGQFLANGLTTILNPNQSIFIGSDTKSFAANQTNEIVIGHNAIGHGSNTVTLGNSSIVTTILRGNVGINTTSPSYKLQVKGNGFAVQGDNLNEGNSIRFLRAAGTEMGYIGWSNESTNNSTWLFKSSNANPIGFSADGINQNMVIDTTGNVGINTTSPNGRLKVVDSGSLSSLAIPFEFGSTNTAVSGWLFGVTNNGTTGILMGSRSGGAIIGAYGPTNLTLNPDGGTVTIGVLGTGTVFSNAGVLTNTNPSDERLKENIDDLEYGLTEILQLRPVTYNWINDTANQGKQFGFIAQEVQEIMPDLIKEFTITEDEEEVVRLGLDKEAIFVAMVNAIKELKAEIELLKQ
jgi:hypothetical protein